MSDAAQSSPSASAPGSPTPRVIGPLAAMCIVVGSTFGIGIFTGPPQVADLLPTAAMLVLLFIGCGILSLGGAFACAELSAMMPKAGGDYVFQRAAFGPSVAFASGWMLVTGVYAAGLAYMTVALSEIHVQNLLAWMLGNPARAAELMGAELFHSRSIGFAGNTVLPAIIFTPARLAAVVFMLGITLLNAWGTKQSARVQTILTLLPFSIVGVLALATLAITPDPELVNQVTGATINPAPVFSLKNLVLAYMPVFFAYSGWNVVVYVGGEVENPGRAIPRALIAGLFAITALYTLLSVAFVHALGMDGLRGVKEAGSASAEIFIGPNGKIIITLLMTVALVTAINGNTLVGARVAFAMARDGVFWKPAGAVSRRATPAIALWVQAAITIALILTGTFNQLLQICSIAMILSGCLNVLALFTLRRMQPGAPRPYRANLYPWLPALYLLANLIAIGVMVYGALVPGEGNAPDWMPLLGVGLFVVIWLGNLAWRRLVPASN